MGSSNVRAVGLLVCALAPLLACEKSEVRAELDGPVKVKLSFEKHWGHGRVPGLNSYAALSITTADSALSQRASCYEPSPELAGYGSALRFAYRCAKNTAWQLVYVTPNAAFTHCKSPLGSADQPNFSAAKLDADGALLELAPCVAGFEDRKAFIEYARQLGEPRLVAVLLEVRNAEAFPDWVTIASELSAQGLESLRVGLRPELAISGAKRTGLCRAVRMLDPNDRALKQHAVSRLEEAAKTPPFEDLPCEEGIPALLKAGAASDAAGASAAACKLLQRPDIYYQQGDHRYPNSYALAAFESLLSNSCTSLWQRLAKEPCTKYMLCNDKLCSADQAKSELSAAASAPQDAGAPSDQPDPERIGQLALLAAAYNQGRPPVDFPQRFARLSYRVDVELTCNETEKAVYPECCVAGYVRRAACGLGSQTEQSNKKCQLLVDAKQKLITTRSLPASDAGSDRDAPR